MMVCPASGEGPNPGVGLFCCRSILSVNYRLFRLADLGPIHDLGLLPPTG
jgi:hypothetical protein